MTLTKTESSKLNRLTAILLLAPVGRSADVARQVLEAAGEHCLICPDAAALREALAEGVGALLLIEEALTAASMQVLREFIVDQPAWSDLPIVLFTRDEPTTTRYETTLGELGPQQNITLLQRPVPAGTLISVMQSALADRRRQIEVRDLLLAERRAQRTLRTEHRKMRKMLQHRVQERTKQIEELTLALTQAEQQERQRIAQFLHDDLQQVLYGLQMRLHMLELELVDADDAQRQLTDTMQEMLKDAITRTRGLTVDLSPPVLQERNFATVLTWLVQEMEELHHLRVDVGDVADLHIADASVRTLLFQIVRELLFNVVKHAETSEARLSLAERDGYCWVVVEDYGTGFDAAQWQDQKRRQDSFGLNSVRDRLQFMGGKLTIESSPAQGTRVTIQLPETITAA